MLKELQKQFRAVVMPSLSLNAAAMVFDGAESDAPALLGFLPRTACRGLLPWSPGRLMADFASFG
nr:MAG: hypothetical protein E5X64_03140 [Mesorhizobium sp.]TJV92620.1 MAG: hypothetical protein E5X84_06050 [Mesorhizobium sp.]